MQGNIYELRDALQPSTRLRTSHKPSSSTQGNAEQQSASALENPIFVILVAEIQLVSDRTWYAQLKQPPFYDVRMVVFRVSGIWYTSLIQPPFHDVRIVVFRVSGNGKGIIEFMSAAELDGAADSQTNAASEEIHFPKLLKCKVGRLGSVLWPLLYFEKVFHVIGLSVN